MQYSCYYSGQTPLDNITCNKCSLFLLVCIPVASEEGYAATSEYGCYLCAGCPKQCFYKDCVNL